MVLYKKDNKEKIIIANNYRIKLNIFQLKEKI